MKGLEIVKAWNECKHTNFSKGSDENPSQLVRRIDGFIDNFGEDFQTEVIDDELFKATVSVCASTTFFRWVFGFTGKITILEPEPVVDASKEMLKKAMGQIKG